MVARNKYKLTYYDWTGLAEITRLMFAYANVPYEDDRSIPLKGNFPLLSPENQKRFPWGEFIWGHVPVLEVDGKQLAQFRAINRFVGLRHGLAGENEFETAKCDEIVDSFVDYLNELLGYFKEMDPEKKSLLLKNALEIVTPKYLSKFNQIVEANGGFYLVGKDLTWPDFVVHHMLTYYEWFCGWELYKNYAALKQAKEHFYNVPQIKNWVATRPKPAWDFTFKDMQDCIRAVLCPDK